MNNPIALHKPVMLEEAISFFSEQKKGWVIDCTFGRGGHTRALLAAGHNVLALDWDHEAVEYAQTAFAEAIAKGNFRIEHTSFDQLLNILHKTKLNTEVSGILFDFGTSVDQLTNSQRGFSVHDEGELDMRMDKRLGVTAKDLLALIPADQLKRLFQDWGGEEEAGSIARAIDTARKSGNPITTTAQLSNLIINTKRRSSGHLHPATKVFQALRIAVNSEIAAIESALPQALEALAHGLGGPIVTIAFHEGEDRPVKHLFAEWSKQGKGTLLTPKVMEPSQAEVEVNSKARSAKLRAFQVHKQ